jgi:Iap family predicted aminopeptidase
MNRTEIEKQMCGELVVANSAYANLVELCSLAPHRMVGAMGELQARDWLEATLTGYGLDVTVEPFEFDGWTRGTASLELLSTNASRTIECLGLWGSSPGVVEAEVLDLGSGTSGDYAAWGDEIPGRIVMLSSKRPAYAGRHLRPSIKQSQAVRAGAVGILWVRSQGGHLIEAGSLAWGAAQPIPGVSISAENGAAIRHAARRGPLRARIGLECVRERTTGWNVVGQLGREDAAQEIIVGAHYDTYDLAPGAVDNGAGVVIMLEAARVLAKYKNALDRRLRFICFSGEEVGLIGAEHYVTAQRAGLESACFMLNLDGPGRREQVGLAVQAADDLVVALRRIIAGMRESSLVDNYLIPYCDAFPFCRAGVPSATVFPIGDLPERGWNHTAADTLDKVRADDLRRDSILIARLLWHAATAPELQVHARSPAQVDAALEVAGYRELLELEGRWRHSAARVGLIH